MGKNGRHLFTSESVTEGHPDKIADQISDAVLDALLAEDPMSRVACETLVTTGLAFIAGEITTKAYVDLPGDRPRDDQGRRLHARQVRLRLRDLRGHLRDPRAVARHRDGRRPRRRRRPGPDVRLRLQRDARADAAADHARAQAGAAASRRCARTSSLDYLRPDGKSQVTVEYDGDKPVRVDAVVISTQHSKPGQDRDDPRGRPREGHPRGHPAELLDAKTKYHINPTGRFVVGGPQGDCGLTGRKIIVDTYGGMGRHGGGAFSGKDPTKVDRSACYMARHVAKNIVAAGLADRAQVQLAYAIGVAEPVSVMVDTFGHRQASRRTKIAAAVREIFPLTPKGIIEYLEPAPPDLQEDRGLRPLRPQRARVHLGADRQGRGAAQPDEEVRLAAACDARWRRWALVGLASLVARLRRPRRAVASVRRHG